MNDIQNLAFVKKYNYKKNYIIFLICNLPIAILGALFLGILIFGINGQFANGLKLTWYIWLTILFFGIILIVFVFKLYGNRSKQEKIFNQETPENYIIYNKDSQSLTVLNKEYSINDIISVDFRYIKKYDILHFAPVNAKDNGIANHIPKTNKGKSSYIERKVSNASKKKTDVGDLIIILKDNKGIFLQRILDIENVYNALNNLISKN